MEEFDVVADDDGERNDEEGQKMLESGSVAMKNTPLVVVDEGVQTSQSIEVAEQQWRKDIVDHQQYYQH